MKIGEDEYDQSKLADLKEEYTSGLLSSKNNKKYWFKKFSLRCIANSRDVAKLCIMYCS